MRKFLLPIINLVNIILVSITFGIAANTAVTAETTEWAARGNYYQLVWERDISVIGVLGFFLFIAAVTATVVAFFPLKVRKFVTAGTAALYIASGVMFLLTPEASGVMVAPGGELTGSLIAMAVLVFVAGALTALMSVLEFLPSKAE